MDLVIEQMLEVFNIVKGQGNYLPLYLAAIVYLMSVRSEKLRFFGEYALIMFIFIIANPLVVLLFGTWFHELGRYESFIIQLPLLVIVPLAGAAIVSSAKEVKEVVGILIACIFVIGIAGSGYGIGSADSHESDIDNKASVTEIEYVLDIVDEDGDNPLMLASKSIVERARSYAPDIRLLYGMDLWEKDMDMGIIDIYPQESMDVYIAMQNPKDTIMDVVGVAQIYECNYLVVDRYAEYKNSMGGYRLLEESENYLIYRLE